MVVLLGMGCPVIGDDADCPAALHPLHMPDTKPQSNLKPGEEVQRTTSGKKCHWQGHAGQDIRGSDKPPAGDDAWCFVNASGGWIRLESVLPPFILKGPSKGIEARSRSMRMWWHWCTCSAKSAQVQGKR